MHRPSLLPSLVAKQHRLVVLRTVEDPNDGNRVSFDTVEDQIAAKDTAADIFVLTSRHQRESERIIRKLRGTLAKGADEISGPQGAVLRDIIANPAQIAERGV
jgi:hypothetical protein